MDRQYQSARYADDLWGAQSPAANQAGRQTEAQDEDTDGLTASPALYSKRSLFALAAQQEEEPQLPEAEAASAGSTAAELEGPDEDEEQVQNVAPPADAAVASPGDDPDAKQRIYSDQHDRPHSAPFERKKQHAERHRVKRDKYNKPSIKSDKIGRDVAARPGVIQRKNGKRDGVFMLKAAQATRYLFVKRGNVNVAEPFDIIEKNDLARHNYKHAGRDEDRKGRRKRLLLNPSMPRKLTINGQERVCVLSWVDGMTAAWLPVGELQGNFGAIVAAVKTRARRWAPDRVSNDPDKIAARSKRYIIRNDRVGQATPADEPNDKPRVLEAGARGGNNVSHYLNKDLRKPAFDAQGNRIANKNVTRSIVAICMNLPSGDAPPLAADTAEAGQTFFVMRDRTFHRQVPVFANGKHRSNILQTWVFGHLAMRDANGKLVPDPSRRGWVPLRVLADARQLETEDIEQRRP